MALTVSSDIGILSFGSLKFKVSGTSSDMIFKLSYIEELTRLQLNEVTAAMFKKFNKRALTEEGK